MSNAFLLIPILLPILCGAAFFAIDPKTARVKNIFVTASVLLTSAAMFWLIFTTNDILFTLFSFSGELTIALNLDGMGKLFAGLVSVLWPATTIYALEYMKHEGHQRMFYAFFLVSFGVTLGIASSGNMLTMYFFYELLTLCTLPLVIQPMTKAALRAGRAYLIYSIGGAAFAFIGLVFLIVYGNTSGFTMGGTLTNAALAHKDVLYAVYFFAFMGFGVKAAVFPLHGWLPKASVAPTPVTALLHAVAVVKAGAFAVIRLTYYSFGADFLRGSWAQYAVMGVAIFTILYGSSAALKQVHFKRRLAYSTVANLSYILFGVTMMTPAGLEAGVLHMLFHSLIKIGAFFAAGAVLHNTGREYLCELDGLGRRMPVTFGCFTVFALALTGIPLFNGFISKWALASAAVETGGAAELIGVIVLLISALLTAMYMLSVSVRAFFPKKGTDTAALCDIREVNGLMTVPMLILAAVCIILGVFSSPIVELIHTALF